jgi:hypothetical protein
MTFREGLNTSRPILSEGEHLVGNGFNILPTAEGGLSPFLGFALQNAKVGSPLMFNVNEDFFGLGNLSSIATAKGSVFSYLGEHVCCIGSGELYRNGVRFQAGAGSSNVSASTSLQIIVKRAGIFTGANTGPFVMGVDVPAKATSGTTTAGVASTKMVTAAVSAFKITSYRSATKGESNATESTATVSHTSTAIPTLTFPAQGSQSEDEFPVYATKHGEGETGPFFWLRDVLESVLTASETKTCSFTNGSPVVTLTAGTVTRDHVGMRIRIADFDGVGGTLTSYVRSVDPAAGSTTSTTLTLADNLTATGAGKTATVDAQVGGIARTLAIEYATGDLSPETAPFTYNKPPTGVFGCALSDVMIVVGCDGDATSGATAANPGTGIAYSIPGLMEAFPAGNRLALPEKPTALISRAAEGYVYVFCKNSLHKLSYVGAAFDGACPLQLTTITNNVGVLKQHNAVLADGELFFYVGGLGFARYNPFTGFDTSFANAVSQSFTAASNADVRVSYDPKTKIVAWGNTNVTTGAGFCYNKATGAWGNYSLPNCTGFGFGIGENFTSSYVLDGQLYMVYLRSAASDLEVYAWNAGAGSTWRARSAFRQGQTGSMPKTLTRFKVAVQGPYSGSMTLSVYSNLNATTPAATKSYTSLSMTDGGYLATWKSNIKNTRSYSIDLTGTATSSSTGSIMQVEAKGTASAITV